MIPKDFRLQTKSRQVRYRTQFVQLRRVANRFILLPAFDDLRRHAILVIPVSVILLWSSFPGERRLGETRNVRGKMKAHT